MGAIVPAILPKSKHDLEERLTRLAGLADWVQIDIIDGKFAAPPTWPYEEIGKNFKTYAASGENLPHWGEFKFEVDLMVENPETVVGDWVALGASRLTIHAESARHLPQLVDDLHKRFGHDKDFATDLLEFGLALNIDTDLALIEPYAKYINYVQFMGIAHIGRQGELFDPRVLTKIRRFKEKHDITMQVDGGVSLHNAPELLALGVDRLVVGSHLWQAPNLAASMKEFNALVEEYGIYE